jgi:hypothetical protein
MALGFSFAPGADQQQMQDQPVAQGAAGGSPQQAVKVLSLRVPKTLPSNAPVSRSLLTGPGSSAPGAGGLDSLVQALLQAFKPAAPSGAPEQPMPQPMQAPGQTAPTFPAQAAQPTGPSFEGITDTPPMQNAPPLFQDGTFPTYQDPRYDEFGNSNDWFNAPNTYNAGTFASAPTPAPRFIVDKDPLGGGGGGRNA